MLLGFSENALLTCALAERTDAKFVEYEGHRFRLPIKSSKSIMYAQDDDHADIFFWWGKNLEGPAQYKTTVQSFDEEQEFRKPGSLCMLSTLYLAKEALVTTFSFVKGRGVKVSGAIPDTVVDSETISAIVEQRVTEPMLNEIYEHCCAKSFFSGL